MLQGCQSPQVLFLREGGNPDPAERRDPEAALRGADFGPDQIGPIYARVRGNAPDITTFTHTHYYYYYYYYYYCY